MEDGAVIGEVGLDHFVVVGERGLVDVQYERQFFIGAAMGGASAQEGDGPIRLMVLIFGVAAAGASTFVILLELLFEGVEVGDALGGRVDADPAGGLDGGLLRWLLSGEAERRKKDGGDCRKNCELLFHEKTPFR